MKVFSLRPKNLTRADQDMTEIDKNTPQQILFTILYGTNLQTMSLVTSFLMKSFSHQRYEFVNFVQLQLVLSTIGFIFNA